MPWPWSTRWINWWMHVRHRGPSGCLVLSISSNSWGKSSTSQTLSRTWERKVGRTVCIYNVHVYTYTCVYKAGWCARQVMHVPCWRQLANKLEIAVHGLLARLAPPYLCIFMYMLSDVHTVAQSIERSVWAGMPSDLYLYTCILAVRIVFRDGEP